MANYLAQKGQKMATKVLFLQTLIVIVLGAIGLLLFGMPAALSAMFGGMMSVLPNGIFALLAFRYAGASQNQMVVRSFSQGAKLKLILTMILAVIAFYGLKLSPLPLFASFMILTVSHWVVTAVVQAKTNDK